MFRRSRILAALLTMRSAAMSVIAPIKSAIRTPTASRDNPFSRSISPLVDVRTYAATIAAAAKGQPVIVETLS